MDSQAFMSGVFVIFQVSILYVADWYVLRRIYPVHVSWINLAMAHMPLRLKQGRAWLVSPHFLLIYSI